MCANAQCESCTPGPIQASHLDSETVELRKYAVRTHTQAAVTAGGPLPTLLDNFAVETTKEAMAQGIRGRWV